MNANLTCRLQENQEAGSDKEEEDVQQLVFGGGTGKVIQTLYGESSILKNILKTHVTNAILYYTLIFIILTYKLNVDGDSAETRG